jgi:hypothetical protein
MSDHFRQAHMFISIPLDKIPKAAEIVEKTEEDFNSISRSLDYNTRIITDGLYQAEKECGGIHIFGNHNYADVDNIEQLAKTLVEDLELEGIFVCSWADTTEPCIADGFDGGAFAIQRGHETVWIHASTEALVQAQMMSKKPVKSIRID